MIKKIRKRRKRIQKKITPKVKAVVERAWPVLKKMAKAYIDSYVEEKMNQYRLQ